SACVLRVGQAGDEAVAFEQAGHRGQRLLAEPRTARQLAHPEPVLFEEGYEQRAVRSSYLAEPGFGEPPFQHLVPAPDCEGKQEPEVAAISRHAMVRDDVAPGSSGVARLVRAEAGADVLELSLKRPML